MDDLRKYALRFVGAGLLVGVTIGILLTMVGCGSPESGYVTILAGGIPPLSAQ